MAYVEILEDGEPILRQELDPAGTDAGWWLRLAPHARVHLSIGGAANVGGYEVRIQESGPSGLDEAESTPPAHLAGLPEIDVTPCKDDDSGEPPGGRFRTKTAPDPAPEARESASLPGPPSAPSSKRANGAPDALPEIEGYRVIEKIDEGGMGTVWCAEQLCTHREVALKCLKPGAFGSQDAHQRFQREIELMASLRHPNIATVYESGEANGVLYYAMELIQGNHLDKYVRQNNLSHHEILELMRTVCIAVQQAHQQEHPIIHRDLKPSNVMVAEKTGRPLVLDFGLARSLDRDGHDLRASEERLVAGTIPYMSPEQARGEELDARSDVYSLGAILYELLTGRLPQDVDGGSQAVLRRIIKGNTLRPRDVRLPKGKKISRDLEALLLKALAHDREGRYATAGELAEDIRRFLNDEPLAAKKPTFAYGARMYLKRNLTIRTAIAATMAVVVGLNVYAYVYHVALMDLMHETDKAWQDQRIRSLAPGQGFADLIKQAKDVKRKAKYAYDQRRLIEAKQCYRELRGRIADLAAKEGNRREAKAARRTADLAKHYANLVGAGIYAKHLWRSCEELYAEAIAKFEAGRLTQAKNTWDRAERAYSDAAAYVAGVLRAWREAIERLKRGDRKKAEEILKRVPRAGLSVAKASELDELLAQIVPPSMEAEAKSLRHQTDTAAKTARDGDAEKLAPKLWLSAEAKDNDARAAMEAREVANAVQSLKAAISLYEISRKQAAAVKSVMAAKADYEQALRERYDRDELRKHAPDEWRKVELAVQAAGNTGDNFNLAVLKWQLAKGLLPAADRAAEKNIQVEKARDARQREFAARVSAADELHRTGQHATALQKLLEALEIDAPDLGSKGRAIALRKKIEKKLSMAQKVNALQAAGRDLMAKRKYKEAREAFEKAKRTDPTGPDVDEIKRYLSSIRTAIPKQEAGVKALAAGHTALSENNLAEAGEDFARAAACEHLPEEEAHQAQGRLARIRSLVAWLSEAKELISKATTLTFKRDCEKALMLIDRFLAVRPDHPEASGLKRRLDAYLLEYEPSTAIRQTRHQAIVTSMAFAPDGKYLASGSLDSSVIIWSTVGWHSSEPLGGHWLGVNHVAFSPNGRYLASGSLDGTVRVRKRVNNRAEWRLLKTPLQHPSGKGSSFLTFARKDSRLLLLSGEMDLRADNKTKPRDAIVWDVTELDRGKRKSLTLRGHMGWVVSAAFKPDGSVVATGSCDSTIRLWSLDFRSGNGKCLQVIRGHKHDVHSLAFLAERNLLASGSEDGTVRLWDLSKSKDPLVKRIAVTEGPDKEHLSSVAFAPDGFRCACAVGPKTGKGQYSVQIWDTVGGRLLKKLGAGTDLKRLMLGGHIIRPVAFSPDGRRIVTGGRDFTPMAWYAKAD